MVNRCFNTEMQQEAIDKVCGLFAAEGSYKLLVIDSIMALFRVDYAGRGELADRQQKLNVMLSRLCKLSEEFNVAVFLTNQYAMRTWLGARSTDRNAESRATQVQRQCLQVQIASLSEGISSHMPLPPGSCSARAGERSGSPRFRTVLMVRCHVDPFQSARC